MLKSGVAYVPAEPFLPKDRIDYMMELAGRHDVTIVGGCPYLIADINKNPDILPKSVKLIIRGGDTIRGGYITPQIPCRAPKKRLPDYTEQIF